MWGKVPFHFVSEGLRRFLGSRKPYATLFIEVSGELLETPPPPWGASRPRTFAELVAVLRAARCDPQLRALLLSFQDAHLGWAQAFELRRCIAKLKDAGKHVWVVLAHASVQEYVAASAAGKLFVCPAGGVELAGLAIETMFFARAMEKLGVEAYFVQAGSYKSAAEVFTRTSMSPAHREMAEQLVDDLYRQVVSAVAESRGWNGEQAHAVCSRGPFSAAEALEAKLVDEVDYPLSAGEKLQKQIGDALPMIEYPTYVRRRQRELKRLSKRFRKRCVALLYASGPIMPDGYGKLFPGAAGRFAEFQRCLRQLVEEAGVKAVVIRIDSPGGSAVASDLLWHEVERLAQAKPVVVSLGSVAASGGYYLALGGWLVVAEAVTLTGSIGVLSGRFRLRRLYDHLGIDKDRVERGAHTALHSDYAELSEEEAAILQRHAEEFHRRFKELVAHARHICPEKIERIANGRVWTGERALQMGLVDQLGGLEDAIREAKQLAGFDPDDPIPVVPFPRPRSLIEMLLRPVRRRQPVPVPPRALLDLLERPHAWAILPYQLTIR